MKDRKPQEIPDQPGHGWPMAVLVVSGLISVSFNLRHAFEATHLPWPLALLYGVGPVSLAAMQSHVVAVRAARRERVGRFRKTLTFGLVILGLALSFLSVYDLLQHAVPDPIIATPFNEPAVVFPVTIDLSALAALHELLRVPGMPVLVPEDDGMPVPESTGETVPVPVPAEPKHTVPESVPEHPMPVPEHSEHEHTVPMPEPVPEHTSVPVLDEHPVHVRAVPDPVPADLAKVQKQAARKYADDLSRGQAPGINRIKTDLHIGAGKAKDVQAYLKDLADRHDSSEVA